ncbi:MFS transporter [Homoserinimonas sp. OAct 916]|uniref:MFS transporter n=1 Tax=Homoserinimonas sp. OAct 916 TaxID=2211450 RepID=UPI000DBE701E|nr:MFS transporter [Homoserinimonas sp. OAct 916]
MSRKQRTPTTSQQRLVLWTAILASFVAFLDGSIITVALPAMARDLGGGLVLQQWVVDAYLLTLGAFILVAGSLSDTFGRGRILRVGLVWFGVASLLCALAPAGIFLILARGLQGMAGALLVPSSLALILSEFSGKAQGRAIGSWTGWTGVAFIAGPILGGLLTDYLSWRWIFLINVIPIGVTLWLLHRMKEPEHIRGTGHIDIIGAVLAAVGLGGPVFALIEQDRLGWQDPLVFLPLILGVVAFAVFLWWESRAPHPMMPLKLFRVRNFSVGNVATTFIYGALSFGSFALTLFLQQTVGFTALAAGLALLPTTIMMLLLSSRFGELGGKYGPRLFMAVGPVIGGVGYLMMLSVTDPINFWLQVLPGVLVFGLGLSITVAPLTSGILGAISTSQAGIGSAVNNAVSRVAGLIAVALTGIIVGGTLDLTGFHRAMLATALMLIAGGVISAIGIQNSKGQKAAEAPSTSSPTVPIETRPIEPRPIEPLTP